MRNLTEGKETGQYHKLKVFFQHVGVKLVASSGTAPDNGSTHRRPPNRVGITKQVPLGKSTTST